MSNYGLESASGLDASCRVGAHCCLRMGSIMNRGFSAATASLIVLIGLTTSAALAQYQERQPKDNEVAEEQAAAARYIASLRTLIATQIVPSLERGILSTANSRPSHLTVNVTDDPSPFAIGARLDSSGSPIVRLSLGYTTMHDAALDAAALAAVLHRPRELRRYLIYQLRLARENERRSGRGEVRRHAMTFAEFIKLDPKAAQTIFAQPQWKRSRERVQARSLGWTIADRLVRADPELAGMPRSPTTNHGDAAARLMAASGMFPVPPFPTALGLAEIDRPAASTGNERTMLCDAAGLMESGIRTLQLNDLWRARLAQDTQLQREVSAIRKQIADMKRDGHCGPHPLTTARTFTSTTKLLSAGQRNEGS